LKEEIPEEIKAWAFWLSEGSLGKEKLPLCPWAKKSILEESVDFWKKEDPMELIPLPDQIKVRIIHFPGISQDDLIEIRNRCNRNEKKFIFLDSHPEDSQLIGGIKSVSSLPLILIQRREELLEARKILQRGKYYSYWDPKVLEEILNI